MPSKAPPKDLHIDPEALNQYYRLCSDQPLEDEGGIRLRPTFGNAQGYREIIQLAKGFQVVVSDITCQEEAFIKMKSDSALKFHLRVEGDSGFGIKEDEENTIKHHTLSVLIQQEGITKEEHYIANQHERSVTLICEPHFLQKHYETISGQLPKEVTRYINSNSVKTYMAYFPMRTDMNMAANSILDNPFIGSLRKGYIFAKSVELLILILQSIADYESNIDKPERGISKRDIDRMQKARDLLDKDYINPPTIGKLARTIGVNEAKLMHNFKRLFGQTIFDYTQNLRMDEAKKLLETTERSITEIAFDVGYEYSSNFTTAFKRRFGITPSVARDAFKS